jgi:zinc transport system ATP-binding protein
MDHVTAHAADRVLSVSDLGVVIEDTLVLEQLSFEVERGEILTILGPNGAGKTQLLRALLGLLPHTGRIRWAPGVRIGYAPQRLPYVREIPITVADFFSLKPDAHRSTGARAGRRARHDAEAHAPEMLRTVGLDPALASRQMGKLSSGQFQRVLIAWALAGDPDVLLFDEPTAGVDVAGAETVYRLLSRLHEERGLTLLLVTHDLAVVSELASRVLCLNKRPVCLGPPLEVLTPETLASMYGAEVKLHRHESERP